MSTISLRGVLRTGGVLFLYFAGVVHAVDFKGTELYGSLDTTVSYGQSYRTESRADELIGIANGGTAFSVNGDDGNLNYDTGLISSTFKFTSELELHYKKFGAFIRATGFKDHLNDHSGDTERTRLSDDAIMRVGQDIKLLDAYAWAGFDLGTMPFDVRVGRQVLSWGESTFIQNSINAINPVDVSKLRVPGSELKEALLPIGMVSAALGVSENLSVEGFYEYDYQRVIIDPPGTYFSTNDFAGDGGNFVALGFGFVPDYISILGTLTPLPNVPGGVIPPSFFPGSFFSATRSPDDRPEDGGQYGAALRWFSPALNNTEFGFYFINYHSRLPIINAISATPGAGSPPFNNPVTPDTPATYFISYPEDIQLYGVSFNTQLGTTGWALQGEYSFRDGVPLQVDDVELLTAALHFEFFGLAAGSPCFSGGVGGPCTSQLGIFGNGVVVPGFIRRDVSQFQMTASRVFGPMLKASQAVLVGEFAVTHVHDMPDQDQLRLDAAGTNLPGNASLVSFFLVSPALPDIPLESNDFADATSLGYRIVGRLDYNNVFGSINLSPRLEWRHDVYGNTPGPGGNFIEGTKVITIGLGANYQNTWTADMSYTNFFGAGSQNLFQDRDFFVFSLGYSF